MLTLAIATALFVGLEDPGDFIVGEWRGVVDYPAWLTEGGLDGDPVAPDQLPDIAVSARITPMHEGRRTLLFHFSAGRPVESSEVIKAYLFIRSMGSSPSSNPLPVYADPATGPIDIVGAEGIYGQEWSRGRQRLITLVNCQPLITEPSISTMRLVLEPVGLEGMAIHAYLPEYDGRLVLSLYLTREN